MALRQAAGACVRRMGSKAGGGGGGDNASEAFRRLYLRTRHARLADSLKGRHTSAGRAGSQTVACTVEEDTLRQHDGHAKGEATQIWSYANDAN